MSTDLEDRIRATEPSGLRPPDLGRIHQRGRRRRAAVRTSAVVGIVAVAVIAVGGVTRFVAPPSVEPVAPTVDASPSRGEAAMSTSALATELGTPVQRITWAPASFAGFTIERATPDGGMAASAWDHGPGPGDVPVATPTGQLWSVDADGRTVHHDPSTGETVTAAPGDDGLGWLPIAATVEGDALVSAIRLDPDPGRPERSTVRRLTPTGELSAVPGVDGAVEADEFVAVAAASPRGVVLGLAGERGSRVVVVGGGDPVTALALEGVDARVVDVAVVADELWVVEIDQSDGDAVLHRLDLDGTAIDVVDLDLGGPVVWRMSVSPDGTQVAVPVGPRASVPTTHLVDAVAVRGGDSPASVATRLAEPGVLTLLAPTSPTLDP